MKRLLLHLGLLALATTPAYAVSYYFSPDVPTDDPSAAVSVYLPWGIARSDSGIYSLDRNLPVGTAIDALHRMNSGDWLFSVEVATELPPGSGAWFEPRDVIRFDGVVYSVFFSGAVAGVPSDADIDAVFLDGGDRGTLVVSFAAPTSLGALTLDPADLVKRAGGVWSLYFDASAATPPVPSSSDLCGADLRGGLVIMSFDVPTTLSTSTYLPGELVSWDPAAMAFSSYAFDPAWPITARADALSFLATPGHIPPTMTVAKSTLVAGDLTLSWQPSCSAGAEDYGIHEGTLGSWYSHGAVTCTDTGGDLTEDITPSIVNAYYLVVPYNRNDEGSYGRSSSGVERPPGSPTCAPTQELGSCP